MYVLKLDVKVSLPVAYLEKYHKQKLKNNVISVHLH